ncbi:MAG TPA: DUF3570 domain-containing protein [Paucimonas sp.]|nr:DUF3570 domain-containing protein [Paucimonas sp.]
MQLNARAPGQAPDPARGKEAPGTAALGTTILAAAFALPGLHTAAHAESAPEQGVISLKYVDYQDRQPGLERTSVRSPSLSVLAPIAGVWAIEGSLVYDDVSGASPRYHTAVSGASRMEDERTAADLKVTRYFPRGSASIGAAYSDENDYRSKAVSLQGSVSSEDKNTTATFGAGVTNDTIDPVNLIVVGERKRTVEWMAGVTQVLSPRDIVQLNFTHAAGRGYFSDPYKYVDNRPRERNQRNVLLRWNHHVDGSGGTSRLAYRHYRDSFGIRAHTFSAEYVQPLSGGWIVTPSARVYSQSAAYFYFDPVYHGIFGPPFPPGYTFADPRPLSADQRLSAFGAHTFGVKVEKRLAADWSVDIKFERYEQRSSWRLFGSGSPGLQPLTARIVQIGVSKRW